MKETDTCCHNTQTAPEGECSCGHHHDHTHEGECGCGHHHDHAHEGECSCGHHHDHAHEGECSCGHHHDHAHEGECGCGHHHDHAHEGECSCGHHHDHAHEGECSCGHHHDHAHEGECGCGHHHDHAHEGECGCGHHHDHAHEGECSCGHHHEEVDESLCTCGHQQPHAKTCPCYREPGHSCSCAMCQLENLSQLSQQPEEEPEEATPWYRSVWLKAAVTVIGAAAAMLLPLGPVVPAVLYGLLTLLWSWELFGKGIQGILHRSLDENSLTSIAIVAAFLLGEYTEALMVSVLFSLGEILEDHAVKKSRQDIAQVVNIRPQTANRVEPSGQVTEIPSRQIRLGDTLLVKVGQRVPVDCRLTEGETTLDQSALTGECVAVGAQPGDTVLAGAVNLTAAFRAQAVSTFEDSTASRIIKLVEESAAQKGRTEKFITRFARVYTPLVVACALAVAFLPPLLGLGSFSMWIKRSLVFLVASCPCALVISVPLAFYSAVGAISKEGVLIKGTRFLEPLAKADTVVFDKTGTITTGELQVTALHPIDPSWDLLEVSAIAESTSSHPLAQAIVQAYAQEHGAPDLSCVKDSTEVAGKGVRLTLLRDGAEHQVLCGSKRMLEELGVSLDGVEPSNVYLAVDGRAVGGIVLSDKPRPQAAQAMQELKALGIRQTIMLTGDGKLSAQAVQQACGIDQIHTDLLPQDKAALLQQQKQQGHGVLFVGDGINDAPVLAAADVGIAMGLGTDAAIESADAVLMSENLQDLGKAIALSRRAVSIVRFNLWFILLVKLAVFVLGIAGLAQMWMAVFADVGVSILSVLNAVRILKPANHKKA